MLASSVNIARRLFRGALRMSEARAGRRFPTINIIAAVLTLLLLAAVPACLIASWAGAGRVPLGYALTALVMFVWLVVIAVVMSYGRQDEAS